MNALLQRKLSRRFLCALLVAGLILSLLPLFVQAAFNHPCYDDFGFSIRTHQAVEAGGGFLGAVWAAVDNTIAIRNTWEGTYTTSFISALQPAIFGENLYWLTTVILLGGFLVAMWLFLREVVVGWLKAPLSSCLVLFCCLAFVAVQFVPKPSEAFFWFNGGVAYPLMWSLMLLRLTVWFRMDRSQSGKAAAGWYGLLLLLTVLVGGSKYSTLLFALVADVLLLAVNKRHRWPKAVATVLLTGLLFFSAMAPGNGVRAATLGAGLSAPMAVAQALFFGGSLMGYWFSLPMVAVWLVALWQLWEPLRRSAFRFRYPLLVTAIAMGLFCAQLTPTLFTGNYLGDGRTVNTYYDTYVLLSTGLVLYWAGYLMRRFEAVARLIPDPAPLRIGVALALAVLLAVGCICYHPEGTESYGPQNMTSGSALRSLLSGETAAYDAAMDARHQDMEKSSEGYALLTPVSDIPRNFMDDIPLGDMAEYVESLYAEYYQIFSVTIITEEEPPC